MTKQPDAKSNPNPNPNPTTKQHEIMNIQPNRLWSHVLRIQTNSC